MGWRHSGFSFNLFSALKTLVSYLPCADGNQDSLACNICSKKRQLKELGPLHVDLIKSHLAQRIDLDLLMTSKANKQLSRADLEEMKLVTFGSLFSTLM